VKRRFQEAIRQKKECINSALDYVVVVSLAGAEASLDAAAEETARMISDLNVRWANGSECS
jgi:ribonuclease P protein component